MTRLLPLLLVLGACVPMTRPTPSTPAPQPGQVGLLVMAHGGSPGWNQTVAEAVAPVGQEMPTVIAYGMADPLKLRAGLDSLRSMGVEHAAVVRMFVSGESFLEQTEYFLGMRPERPSTLFLMGRDPSGVGPIAHDLDLATHQDGLMGSTQARRILIDRALEVSKARGDESVLLLAHGMGDEGSNGRVLAAMDQVTAELESVGFATAVAATLREDWADKREVAEASIREFVTRETAAGRRVIVVPMRLSGFGPYAEVLAGLDYTPATGLLPHPEVTDWIRDRATSVLCAKGWVTHAHRCQTVLVDPAQPSH